MKSILSIIFSFLFFVQSVPVFANSNGNNLRQIIQEFQFDLDQAASQDDAFKIVNSYSLQLEDSFKNLSSEELIIIQQELLAKTPVSFQKDYSFLVANINFEKLSSDQKIEILKNLIDNSRSTGAAWSGEVWTSIGATVLAAAVLYIMADAFVCGALSYAIFGKTWAKNGCEGR